MFLWKKLLIKKHKGARPMVTKEVSILNLNEYRAEKQAQSEKCSLQLHSMAIDYVNRSVNIREKVRAKHIFRNKLGLPANQALLEQLDEIFLDWFLFDYKTIQRTTIFNQFIKEMAKDLKEYEMIQAALCISAVMEPFVVTGQQGKDLFILKSMVGEISNVRFSDNRKLSLHKGSALMLRKVHGLEYDFALGPTMVFASKEECERIKHAYNNMKETQSDLTWRAFLKLQALEILPPLKQWSVIKE